MMRKKESFQEEFYYGFSLDDKVPENHLLRKIKEVVDFRFVYELVEKDYSHTGAPSVDPVVIFKLSLIGYLYDISSERRLIEEASLNMSYLFFIDYKITETLPDHSIFTKARKRFGVKAYRDFFDQVVKVCADAGLVKGDTAFLDATIIDSKVPHDALRSRTLVEQLKNGTDNYLNNLDWESGSEKSKSGDKGNNKDLPLSPKAKLNRALANKKDPEAQVSKQKNQMSRLGYKGHIAVDGGEARVITACHLTGGAYPEEHLLWQLVADHELITEIPLKALGADTRYSTSDNYRFLKAKGILPAIPLRKGGLSPRGGYGRERFIYDKSSDTFTCPQSKALYPAKPVGHWKTYRSRKSDCNRCSKRELCLVEGAQRRTLMISKNHSVTLWAGSLVKTAKAEELLRKRKIWPETVFAHAKNFHGLRRARFKGRWKTEIQALLTFSAINLKKLVKYQGKKTGIAGQSSANILKTTADIILSLFLRRNLLPV